MRHRIQRGVTRAQGRLLRAAAPGGVPGSRSRRHQGGVWGALLATTAAVALLAGCASGPPNPTASGGSSASPSASGSSIDPRTITGPSTAHTVAEVTPLSPAPTPALPVTVTDERGKKVTVTDASRMLALDVYGTLAETVVGLGLGDRLVGRSSSNTLSTMASLPVVTENGHNLNAEAILALRPTLVLIDTTIGPSAVRDQLEASGVTTVYFSPKRELDTVPDRIAAVADALGVPEAGTTLATRVKDEIADARAQIATMAPAEPLRMVFLYIRGTAGVFFVFGKGEGADELIDALSGEDVASEAGLEGIKPASAEALLATNPEVILVMTDGLASTGGVDGLLARPGVADTTAGQRRRVVDMADGQVLSFGPSTAAVLLSLADAVYQPDVSR